jgi:hypothetical protein
MKSHLLATGLLSLGLLTTLGVPAIAHHGNAAYADDITEFKQETAGGRRLYAPNDGHLTPEGAALAARRVGESLRAQGVY